MCGVISNFSTWQMWRFLRFIHMWRNFRFLHTVDVEKYEISPYVACVWCKNVNTYTKFKLFCQKKNHFFCNLRNFVAKLLCLVLRTFVWRKIYPKIALLEKKWQIWGITLASKYQYLASQLFERDCRKNLKSNYLSPRKILDIFHAFSHLQKLLYMAEIGKYCYLSIDI